MQLHQRDVVQAATALLDSYGIADLTMRRLARELDVSPGALYWHFANKQQLLGAVADRILEPVLAKSEAMSWSAAMIDGCTFLRDALLSHTDGAELVSASFAAGQSAAASEILARLSGAARAAGFGVGDADLVARTVVYYVLGFTVDEQSRLQWDAAGADLPGSASAALADDGDRRFSFGVRLLIHGMSADRVFDTGISVPVPQTDGGGLEVDADAPHPQRAG